MPRWVPGLPLRRHGRSPADRLSRSACHVGSRTRTRSTKIDCGGIEPRRRDCAHKSLDRRAEHMSQRQSVSLRDPLGRGGGIGEATIKQDDVLIRDHLYRAPVFQNPISPGWCCTSTLATGSPASRSIKSSVPRIAPIAPLEMNAHGIRRYRNAVGDWLRRGGGRGLGHALLYLP